MSGLWEPAHAVPRARDPATGSCDLAQEAAGPQRHPRPPPPVHAACSRRRSATRACVRREPPPR
eukprot:7284262-Prymnesium_polylepis.1